LFSRRLFLILFTYLNNSAQGRTPRIPAANTPSRSLAFILHCQSLLTGELVRLSSITHPKPRGGFAAGDNVNENGKEIWIRDYFGAGFVVLPGVRRLHFINVGVTI
jgi:hypothetical protein